MEKKINLFAIVITHNGEDTIYDCLSSLENNNYPLQTIVVENASTDSTGNIVNKFPKVIFLPQKKNLGFGQANNIAMKYALDHGADYVFLFNQDASIKEDTIEKLLKFAVDNKEYGILSPLHLNGDGSEIDSKVVMYLTKNREDFISDLYFGKVKKIYETTFINAAAWLISRDCINKVGGFDDLFFMYGEDVDYCARAIMKNFKIGILPDTVMFHHRTGNRPQKSVWKNINQVANYNATLVKVDLKRQDRPYIKSLLLWRIEHNRRKCETLVKGQISDFLVLLLAGLKVFFSLPKVYIHKKKSLQSPAFWNF